MIGLVCFLRRKALAGNDQMCNAEKNRADGRGVSCRIIKTALAEDGGGVMQPGPIGGRNEPERLCLLNLEKPGKNRNNA